jgi:hypothetical protein
MQHVLNKSFPTTPKLNSYEELVHYVESYRISPLYEMREINGLIFEFETNKILLSQPPQISVYYKYQSEPEYKKINLFINQAKEFIETFGIETNDKLLLEQFTDNKLNIKQRNIKIFC